MAERFGQLLLRYRVAAGLSQERLAELAGLSTNAISALERGLRHAPHSATLDLLIAALKLDDDARVEIEEAAKWARARRIQAQHDQEPDLPDDFPLDNLPPELTSFVDREKEVPEIEALLESHRLVTLVGAGGSGKTRCAIKIAGNVRGSFVDGVWLADLTTISDPQLVATVIARAFKLQEAPNRPMIEMLIAYFKRRRLLLILDNCEHVIDEASHVASAILHNCPNVCILATSRESLGIAGEQTFRMPSLPVPSASELLDSNELSQYGSVQLFTDRAFSADSRFTLTVESARHVADICRRLDGIPLAIELAAARVKALSPKQLVEKLDERFRVLISGNRNVLQRHRTMRALIDWSYDLLSDDERQLFRTLSIFAGGFTIDTSAAVCEGDMDEIEIMDLLSSLVDKSLVQVEVIGTDRRYRLLESTRQYAREKLESAGEVESVAYAHGRAFLKLAERLQDAWETTSDRAWHAQAEPELQNFRTALLWAFGAQGDVLLGQRLASALRRVWLSFSPAEGWRWVQIALKQATEDTPAAVLAGLDLAEAVFAYWFERYKACASAADRAVTRYHSLNDQRGLALAQLLLGRVTGDQPLVERALEALQILRDRRSVIIGLTFSASGHIAAGDLAGARRRFSEALAATSVLSAEHYSDHIKLSLAEVEFRDGNASEALRLAVEVLGNARDSGDTLGITRARHDMAAYLVALGRFDEARTTAQDAVATAHDAQFSTALAWALQHLAAIAALRPSCDVPLIEDRRRAARILGFVDARLVVLEALRQYTERREYDAVVLALRDALGEDELSRFKAEGETWSEDQAVTEAMLI